MITRLMEANKIFYFKIVKNTSFLIYFLEGDEKKYENLLNNNKYIFL